MPLKLGPARAPADPCRLRRRLRRPGPTTRSTRWLAQLPRLETDSHLLGEVVARTARDLIALRIEAQYRRTRRSCSRPPGLPWFLTLFGRDTLLTRLPDGGFGPGLAKGALLALAALPGDTRATTSGTWSRARSCTSCGWASSPRLGLKPHSPYYGSADSTPLWLILLSEYWRWTGDDEAGRARCATTPWRRWTGSTSPATATATATSSTGRARRRGSATSAGATRTTASSSPTGRCPFLPIATAEIQGYVYDAKLRLAELADGPFADPALATRLRAEAAPCASASSATSGSTPAAATTRSGSTATSARSIR